MMPYVLTYIIVSFIYVSISAYLSYLKLKEELKKPHYESANYLLELLSHALRQTESGRQLKKKLFSPYVIIGVSIGAIIYSPFAFPGTLFRHIKKLLGIQTKSDKKLKQEEQEFIRAHEESQEFMKKEGLGPPIVKIDMIEKEKN